MLPLRSNPTRPVLLPGVVVALLTAIVAAGCASPSGVPAPVEHRSLTPGAAVPVSTAGNPTPSPMAGNAQNPYAISQGSANAAGQPGGGVQGIQPPGGSTQPGLVAAAPAATQQPGFSPPPQVVTEPVESAGRIETRPLTPATQIGMGSSPAAPPVATGAAPVQSPAPMTSPAAPAASQLVEVARTPSAMPAPATPGRAPAISRPAPEPATPAVASATSPARSAEGTAFIWPASGSVVNSFKTRKSKGIGISGRAGDPIAAAADGEVIFSGLGPRGYGKLLIVKHKSDWLSVYAHNKNLLVKEGQAVRQGQKIAELGSTGTDRPKLHFEIRRQGKPVDPLAYLPQRN